MVVVYLSFHMIICNTQLEHSYFRDEVDDNHLGIYIWIAITLSGWVVIQIKYNNTFTSLGWLSWIIWWIIEQGNCYKVPIWKIFKIWRWFFDTFDSIKYRGIIAYILWGTSEQFFPKFYLSMRFRQTQARKMLFGFAK